MALPIQIDEGRVIKLHKDGLSVKIISLRFGCSSEKIRNTLIRRGFDPTKHREDVITAGWGGIRRLGHRQGLGD